MRHREYMHGESSDTCNCIDCAKACAIASMAPRDDAPAYVFAIVLMLSIAGLCWLTS
jgi:hypothetical protein